VNKQRGKQTRNTAENVLNTKIKIERTEEVRRYTVKKRRKRKKGQSKRMTEKLQNERKKFKKVKHKER
jgi:hypothetical protein